MFKTHPVSAIHNSRFDFEKQSCQQSLWPLVECGVTHDGAVFPIMASFKPHPTSHFSRSKRGGF